LLIPSTYHISRNNNPLAIDNNPLAIEK